MLAIHYCWEGVFIDKDAARLGVGKSFYKKYPGVKFIEAEVRMDNVNQVLSNVPGNAGLLSVDIDGNDYWVWKAIDRIRPRIVVIEAKVEFGEKNLIVPYGPNNHHSSDKMYNGASVEAFRRLGKEKGYKLIGANKHGYNLFFVEENEPIRAVSTTEILAAKEITPSFYSDDFFTDRKFETDIFTT